MIGLSRSRPRVWLFGWIVALAGFCLLVGIEWPPSRLASRLIHGGRKELKLDWVDPDRSEPAGTKYQTFFSPAIQRNVSYLIYLPPGYESAAQQRYPVIYWLHGRGGRQSEGAASFVPGLDRAIRSGKIPPTIGVLLNGLGGSRWIDSPDGKRPMETVIIRDLIPHIDATYRTIAARSARAVEGFSMGGFGAAHLGFKFPEVFGVVSMLSASLFDEGGDPEFLEATSPWNLVNKNAAAIRGRTLIRMIVGSQDSLVELNQKYDRLLDDLHIEHEFVVLPGVGHNEERLYQRLGERAFSFYAKAWMSPANALYPAGKSTRAAMLPR
jgi:enterochelin esterase-like enzyme